MEGKDPTSPWLTTDEAARYLSVAPGTLRNWRVDGQGPTANTVGRIVRYHRNSLDAFMREGDLANNALVRLARAVVTEERLPALDQ